MLKIYKQMKKITKFKLTLAFMATLFSTANVLAEDYNLWICGTQVTDANKDNLTVINGTNGCTVTGIISYNSGTKTLALNEATIGTTGNVYCIQSKIPGMKIEVTGTNILTGSGWSSISFEDNNYGAIQGDGTLEVQNTHPSGQAIFMKNSSLVVKNCTLNAKSGKNAIFGNSGEHKLIFENATVTADLYHTGIKEGTIQGFSKIYFNGCALTEPLGAVFNADQKTICKNTDGTIFNTQIKIEPATLYGLKICDVPVTSLNKDNLSDIPGITKGTVYYSPEDNTLTLDGAQMSMTGNRCCILSHNDGLIIDVNGNNYLEGDGWSPISIVDDNSGTIQGSGELYLTNKQAEDQIIFVDRGSLTIRNCTISATEGRSTIFGYSGEGTLTIDNATMTAFLNETEVKEGSIIGFDININTTKTAPVNMITEIDELAETLVRLYPNPVESMLTIERNNNDEVVIELYNNSGTLVSTLKTSNTTTTIDVEMLSSGIYFVRIIETNKTTAHKFIKR